LVAGLAERDRRIVIDRLGIHRTNHAQVVGDLGHVGQQFAHPHPALAVLGKSEDGGCHGKLRLSGSHRRQSLTLADGLGQIFAVSIFQIGLGIKQIHLRRSTRLKQINDSLGLRREVGEASQRDVRFRTVAGGSQPLLSQQRTQRRRTGTSAGMPQKGTAIQRVLKRERSIRHGIILA
jgi:hypothetical protein